MAKKKHPTTVGNRIPAVHLVVSLFTDSAHEYVSLWSENFTLLWEESYNLHVKVSFEVRNNAMFLHISIAYF
jgi:hypothetical protein